MNKGKKLTSKNNSNIINKVPLLNNKTSKFEIAIKHPSTNNFSFETIHKNEGHKKFHRFISITIGEGLTISEVDKLYLKTRGKKKL